MMLVEMTTIGLICLGLAFFALGVVGVLRFAVARHYATPTPGWSRACRRAGRAGRSGAGLPFAA